MKNLFLLCILFVGILSSCVQSISPQQLSKKGLKQNEGLIVGKFQIVSNNNLKPNFVKPILQVRNVTTNSQVILSPVNLANNDPLDLKVDTEGVFAAVVPAGNYEIISWSLDYYPITITSRLPMNVPFTVQPNQSTYLGHANVLMQCGEAKFTKKPYMQHGIILLSDNYQKDVAEIKMIYPTTKSTPFIRSKAPKKYMQEMKRIAQTKDRAWFNF